MIDLKSELEFFEEEQNFKQNGHKLNKLWAMMEKHNLEIEWAEAKILFGTYLDEMIFLHLPCNYSQDDLIKFLKIISFCDEYDLTKDRGLTRLPWLVELLGKEPPYRLFNTPSAMLTALFKDGSYAETVGTYQSGVYNFERFTFPKERNKAPSADLFIKVNPRNND